MCNAVNFDYQYKTNEKIQWYKDLSTFACHYAQLIILICCLPDNGKQWRSLENLMLECKIIDNDIFFAIKSFQTLQTIIIFPGCNITTIHWRLTHSSVNALLETCNHGLE